MPNLRPPFLDVGLQRTLDLLSLLSGLSGQLIHQDIFFSHQTYAFPESCPQQFALLGMGLSWK